MKTKPTIVVITIFIFGFIQAFSQAPVKQWDADFGGSSNDYLTSIQQTTDAGYILGGYSSSPVSGHKTQNTQGGTDYWMVKTDTKGLKQWDSDFGGSDFDFSFAIQQTIDGGYIVGGYSSSGISGDKTQATKGLNDYWIVKTSAATTCSTPINLRTVAITSKEATLRWGAVNGVVKYQVVYRQSGTVNWTVVNTKNNYKRITDLSPNTKYQWRVRSVCSKRPLVASRWSGIQSFSTTTLQAQAVAEAMLAHKNFSGEVYPNPVSQSATISFSLIKASPVVITITDVNGRLLQVIANADFSAGSHTIKFSRGSLTAGIYFLQVKINQGVMMKKIVIE
jgi:hypothetical protein